MGKLADRVAIATSGSRDVADGRSTADRAREVCHITPHPGARTIPLVAARPRGVGAATAR